jgi:hypothetical protein
VGLTKVGKTIGDVVNHVNREHEVENFRRKIQPFGSPSLEINVI